MPSPSLPTRADLLSPAVAVGAGALAVLLAVDLSVVPIAAAFGAAALVAAVLGRSGATIVVAALSLVALLVSGVGHGLLGHGSFEVRAAVSVATAGLAVASARLRERGDAGLERMTVIAATAQSAVLRSTPDALGPVGLATRYVSASEGALVGGDLYEAASTPHGVRVLVGDVCGKGLPAVHTASSVLSGFRQAAFTEADLVDLARRVDLAIAHVTSEEQFVTAVVAEFEGDVVRVANCGHPPPMLVHAGGVTALETVEESVPLGLGADPVVTRHAWPRGARLLLYTDGLLEQRDRTGRFFDLPGHLPALGEGTLEEALDDLVEALRAHGGGRIADDVALVLAENRA